MLTVRFNTVILAPALRVNCKEDLIVCVQIDSTNTQANVVAREKRSGSPIWAGEKALREDRKSVLSTPPWAHTHYK